MQLNHTDDSYEQNADNDDTDSNVGLRPVHDGSSYYLSLGTMCYGLGSTTRRRRHKSIRQTARGMYGHVDPVYRTPGESTTPYPPFSVFQCL
jgi:hypothetical protein